MKKNALLVSLALMGLSLFSACGDDKEDNTNPVVDPVEEATIDDSEYDAIINQYVDAVVMPTYNDLKVKNSALYQAVVAFGNAPSDANFQEVCNAWLAAREPWESSEAFLFGPVDELGLDPNMDSWPLDQDAIKNVLSSGDFSGMEWDGEFEGEDENGNMSKHAEEIAEAQSIRGFHTLEFLLFKNGQPRTVGNK